MSMVRAIKRQMMRELTQEVVRRGKLTCPRCKQATLKRRNVISRKVDCPKCGYAGKIK